MKIRLKKCAVLTTALAILSLLQFPPTQKALAQTETRERIASASAEIATDNSEISDSTENSVITDNKTETAEFADSSTGKFANFAAANLSATKAFNATAYCLNGRTAMGTSVRRGIIAADPRVLPLGTRVELSAGGWSGTYTVADTGGAVKGRRIDVWVPNASEARKFGRRTVHVTVLGRK